MCTYTCIHKGTIRYTSKSILSTQSVTRYIHCTDVWVLVLVMFPWWIQTSAHMSVRSGANHDRCICTCTCTVQVHSCCMYKNTTCVKVPCTARVCTTVACTMPVVCKAWRWHALEHGRWMKNRSMAGSHQCAHIKAGPWLVKSSMCAQKSLYVNLMVTRPRLNLDPLQAEAKQGRSKPSVVTGQKPSKNHDWYMYRDTATVCVHDKNLNGACAKQISSKITTLLRNNVYHFQWLTRYQ